MDPKIALVERNLLTVPNYIIGGAKPLTALADRMPHYHTPGVSVAVIDHGALAWAKGYGVADVRSGVPVSPETIFYAASLSKPITAMAALSLVQSGLLDLDEDVNRTLRSWRVPENAFTVTEKVTLRRLLSHRAGMSAGFYRGYAAGEPVPTLTQLLRGEPPSNSGPAHVEFVPGSQSCYSGVGYWVIQQLIEDVTGENFAVFAQRVVLNKLGMQHSTFHNPLPPHLATAAASGHDNNGAPADESYTRHPGLTAGGLWTTPSDLARFLIELQTAAHGQANRVLSAELAQLMVKEQIEKYSLGLHTFNESSTLRVSHGGSGDAFLCLMAAFPERGQGAAVMINSAGGWGLIMELFRSLAEVYEWPDYRARGKHIIPVLTERLAKYSGVYQLSEEIAQYGDYTGQWQVNHMPEVLFTVQQAGQTLLIRNPVGEEFCYYPQSENSFFAVESDGDLHFVNDSAGRADQLELIFQHTRFRAQRKAAGDK